MTSGSITQLEVFSTDLPAEQRIELWQTHTSESLMRLRCRSLAESDFHGATVDLRLPRTRISRVTAESADVIERKADLVRRRPEDSLVLFFVLAGETFFYHENGVHTLRPGQLVACDCDKPFMRGFSDDFEEPYLEILREVLKRASEVEPPDTPLVMSFEVRENLIAATVVMLLAAATRVDDARTPDEESLVGLAATLLGGRERAAVSYYLAAARRYIDARLGDAPLAAVAIAASVGVSTRHLSRTLAAAGTTAPQYVLARRPAVAKRLLLEEKSAALPIAEISRRCGFTSSTHFSTAFRRCNGQGASDVRREAKLQRARSASIGDEIDRGRPGRLRRIGGDGFADSDTTVDSSHNNLIRLPIVPRTDHSP